MSKKERQAEWVWHMQPSYRRLSRYDQTGLIWLLQGRPVVALTEAAAAIQNSTGAITIYLRHNKPALGPPPRNPRLG
jgi:hypothetical protein